MSDLSISLGGVVLHQETVWIDRDHWSKVSEVRKRTLAGVSRRFRQEKIGGRSIGLECPLLNAAARDALIEMANDLGGAYGFSFRGEVYQVEFDHSNERGLIIDPLDYFDASGSPLYQAVISLMTI